MALQSVEKYTLPVILSRRFANGQVSSGCASFIVVNRDGWILTAAHVVQDLLTGMQHQNEWQGYQQQRSAIANDPKLNDKAKRKQIKALQYNPQWITNFSAVWGSTTMQIRTFHIDALADIAIGKLEPFDPASIAVYPVFKNPASPMLPGTSLCRLGFPFHKIEATFDQNANMFTLSPNALPVPRFPNDGIHTRIAIASSQDGARQAKFIETSTPGLRGQSGGPIFDRDANIWAMQSRTHSMALGIAPEVTQGSKVTVEHQFMHVGWGSHVEEIVRFLRNYGVAHSIST